MDLFREKPQQDTFQIRYQIEHKLLVYQLENNAPSFLECLLQDDGIYGIYQFVFDHEKASMPSVPEKEQQKKSKHDGQ